MGKFRDKVITTDAKWTTKEFLEYVEEGRVSFDNIIQRKLVWNRKQKSLLISSIIENYMPPEFLANKKDGIFDMIDGKQRFNAILGFVKNKYKLSDVPDIYDDEGNVYELNDKSFSDLTEEIQDKILRRSFKVEVMDNASQDVVREFFFRRNNGTQLSAARKILAQAKSFEEILMMSQHPIFTTMFKQNAQNNDDTKNIAERSYVILVCENKSLESKKISQYIKSTTFTEENVKRVTDCYDTLMLTYETIKERGEKADKKILRKMLVKTHFVSLVPVADYVNANKIDLNKFADWVIHFFSTIKEATISDVYNTNATSGSSKVGAVEARLNAMMNDFLEFIAK